MSDISVLEQRITAAIQRISAATEAVLPNGGAVAPAPTETAAPENVGMDALAALDAQLSQVMKSNAQLRASNQALRSANAEGLGDVNLVNAAMQAEIDTLTAERAAEAAQLEILLKALTQTSEEPRDA
jgi:flagellin-like hook-associated protein FlgL